MSKQENQSPAKTESLGETFRQARQALNLSLEDVSNKINLRVSILQHIEDNQFIHSAVPATFMKGYIRSYARFLRIPESLLENFSADYGEISKNDLTKNTRTHKLVNRYHSHNRWIGYLTAIILLAVVGMTALWWWESYQKSSAERDNLVENYVTSENSPDKPQETTVTTDSSVSTPSLESTEQTSNLTDISLESKDNVSTDTTNNEQATTSTTTLQTEINKIDNSALTEDTVTASSTPSSDNNSVIQDANLKIEIVGPACWISVKDKHRKLLTQKEYKQGEVLTFNEQEGYSVIIGAPNNVKITYQGKDFPLTVDGRVAKFKLPQ